MYRIKLKKHSGNVFDGIIDIENEDEAHCIYRLLVQLQELQADLEELSDKELLECRDAMLNRVNECLEVLEESNEDNQ